MRHTAKTQNDLATTLIVDGEDHPYLSVIGQAEREIVS
jgi:hypothetical protein